MLANGWAADHGAESEGQAEVLAGSRQLAEGSQPNYRTIFQEMRYQSGSGGKRLTCRTPCRGTAIQGATVSFQRR